MPKKKKISKQLPNNRQYKKLISVRKELQSARQPIYLLNRKIKTATSKYYERKYKKERKALLESIEPKIKALQNERDNLRVLSKEYEQNKKEKRQAQNKSYSLQARINKAVNNGDIKEAEKLRYELLNLMGLIEKFKDKMGDKSGKKHLSDFDPDSEDGGQGYELDSFSPYAIWEAVRQINKDLDSGDFKFFIINGIRYSAKNVIEIRLAAQEFLISTRKGLGDSDDYVNRFINEKKESVKYKIVSNLSK